MTSYFFLKSVFVKYTFLEICSFHVSFQLDNVAHGRLLSSIILLYLLAQKLHKWEASVCFHLRCTPRSRKNGCLKNTWEWTHNSACLPPCSFLAEFSHCFSMSPAIALFCWSLSKNQILTLLNNLFIIFSYLLYVLPFIFFEFILMFFIRYKVVNLASQFSAFLLNINI